MLLTDRDNDTDHGTDHERATAALLPVLLEVKTLVRHLAQHDGHGPAGSPLAALALVERCSPARVSDLADAAHLDPSVVSRQAKALRALGLVEVEADPGDGRARRLRLSEEGERTLADARSEIVRLVQERLSEWSADDLRSLHTGLRRLVDDLRPILTTPTDPTTRRTHL